MAKDKVAAVFDIIKWEDDHTIEDFTIIHSHPSLEDFFLFHEDLLDNFFDIADNDEWDNLPINRMYRVFIVLSVSPEYSTNYEYGVTELDGWDWDVMVLTYEDLGEVDDDTSIQP